MKDKILRIMGIHVLIFVLILLRGFYEIKHFRIKRYSIKTDRIKRQTTFAFISDLHNCNYGRHNDRIIAAIKQENPEFLIIGGDLIVGKRNIGHYEPEKYFNNAVSFLKGISGEFPILYTYGNHETRIKNKKASNPLYNAYMEKIKEQKIIFLNDDVWSDGNITVAGFEADEDSYDDRKAFDRKKLKALMSLADKKSPQCKDCFRILVSHPPDFFDLYSEENADLILCGHNHGGTIRIPGLGGVISRKYKLFPKYSYGLYKKNGKKMILTGGLGDHTIHFRLFNTPEIVIITLVKD